MILRKILRLVLSSFKRLIALVFRLDIFRHILKFNVNFNILFLGGNYIIMKKLKFKIYVYKNRKILAIIFTFVIIFFLVKIYKSYNFTKITNNPTTFGVIATLLGAVIGGVFTLLGSVWVNKREQKSIYNLRRKNIIYSPLYDELINIKRNILEKNQYPVYIAFGIGQQTIIPHPQYSAWDRIKNDTRYLEVPLLLKDQMEKLYDTLREYITIRNSADAEIKE